MKKILLPLLMFPLAVLAQNSTMPLAKVSVAKSFPQVKEDYSNFPKADVQAGVPVLKNDHTDVLPQGAYKPAVIQKIGNTTYDLQTNGALAKRLQLYSGNELSAVWIKSDGTDPNYPTRFSGYNHFNGSTWGTQNTSSFEYDRNGWPNIDAVTANGSTYEMLTSHYAAAGGTNYAGGIFWYKNSGIGKTDFTQTVDLSNDRSLTQGLLWPRMASSDDKVFLIGTYQNSNGTIHQAGVKNPIVYFRYNATTKKFTAKNITLPGYDSTRYLWGAADEYSLDARGKYVAVLIGGITNDLALWKSSDSGYTFTKTVVQAFKYAPYDYKIDPTFADTVRSNDGSGTVTLDGDGVAHVTYTDMPVLNPTGGDSGVNFLGSTRGVIYWNDKDQTQMRVGYPLDYDHDSTINLTSNNLNSAFAGYPGHNFASYSNTAVDAQGHIFVVYSCPHEMDKDAQDFAYRHIYVSAFDGTKWHQPQDLIQSWQVENAFPTVARDADDKLHIMFLQDQSAGIFVPNSNNGSLGYDTVKYAAISTSDILGDKVGNINLGINDQRINNSFTLGNVFPNPANSTINIGLNMKHSSAVSVKLVNILGTEMQAQNFSMLPSGYNRLNLDVNTLPSGIYMINITAGGFTSSQRIVIER